MKITKKLIKDHNLTDEEYQKIIESQISSSGKNIVSINFNEEEEINIDDI